MSLYRVQLYNDTRKNVSIISNDIGYKIKKTMGNITVNRIIRIKEFMIQFMNIEYFYQHKLNIKIQFTLLQQCIDMCVSIVAK